MCRSRRGNYPSPFSFTLSELDYMPPVKKPVAVPTDKGSAKTQMGLLEKEIVKTPLVPPPSVLAKIQPTRPVLYPKYEVKIYATGYEGPIDFKRAIKLLKWETESEYTARKLNENPGMLEKKAKFGEHYLLTIKGVGTEKVKVKCWNNARNRPFDLVHAEKICQDTLNRNWEMNGENIIIGKTGLVLSGQHRLIGLILAILEWRAHTKWKENWPEEPYIETCIFYGCSEDPKVVRTLDNVKARTLSDTIYTSPLFDNLPASSKWDCARYMDSAIDLLWKRTKQADAWNKHQTHSSSLDFLDKHPKIKQCVKHIFDNNRNKGITALKLSPGNSAAMMYLMACSSTDGEDYHYPSSPKQESQLKWDRWDKACEFWSGLVDPENEMMEPVRGAIANLKDPFTEAAPPQKLLQIVLSLAWNRFIEEDHIARADLDIGPYLKWSDDKGRTLITEEPTVGGIDQGVVKGGGEQESELPTPEEQEAEKERLRSERAESMLDTKKSASKNGKDQEEAEDDEEMSQPVTTTNGKPFSDDERKALVAKVTKKSQEKVEPKKDAPPKAKPRPGPKPR